MSHVSPVMDTAIGATAGVLEVTVNQPLIFFKNALQMGVKIPPNPLTWYRGYGVNALSLAPITAVQVAASGIYQSLLFSSSDKARAAHAAATNTPVPATPLAERAISAFFAGVTSGFISGPAESVIVQQQLTGASAIPTLKSMIATKGISGVYRGASQAMVRDGLFTSGFMVLGPYLNELCAGKTFAFARSSGADESTAKTASVVGGLGGSALAGVISAVVTHPSDTVKTRMQKDFRGERYSSQLQAWREGSLFKGVSARGLRVCIGVCIISNFTVWARKAAAERAAATATAAAKEGGQGGH